MTTIKILKQADYKDMPWKNGLGITSQIDIFPAEAEFPGENFLWRVSSAFVQNNNPFSQFPGCDRFLAVYQGQSLRLNGKDLHPTEVIHFRGEELIQSELTSGPILDIGVIYSREKVLAEMSFFRAIPGSTLSIPLHHESHYLFCAKGGFSCQDLRVTSRQTLTVNKPRTQLLTLNLTAEGTEELELYLIQLSNSQTTDQVKINGVSTVVDLGE